MHQRKKYVKGSFIKKLVNTLMIAMLMLSAFTMIFIENVAAANADPTQNNEAPTNSTTGVNTTPPLYVIVYDTDSTDVVNVTWWSNATGGVWAVFGTNLSVANNTNITQINGNFSQTGTKYWWRVNISDGNGSFSNETYSLTTNYAPTTGDIQPPHNSENQTRYPILSVQCNDTDLDTMTLYWYWINETDSSWNLFGTNTSVNNNQHCIQNNSNFSQYSQSYNWTVNLTDGKNWSNSSTFMFVTQSEPGEEPPPGGGGNFFVNEWSTTVSPTYQTNGYDGTLNFTLPRNGQQPVKLNSLNISLPSGFTYVDGNGTSINAGNPTQFTVSNGSNYINWTKSPTGGSEGFCFNSTENFWFIVNTSGSLGSRTIYFNATGNNSNTQSFTMTVFITVNFSFNGSIYNQNGTPLSGAIGQLTVQNFGSGGPPISIGLFSDASDANGEFNITGIPTTIDPNAQGPPTISQSDYLFYSLSAKELYPNSPYALNTSVSLPSLPYSELVNMMDAPQMWLKKAITFNVSVTGPSYNWETRGFDYGAKNFQVMAKDLKLGFTVQQNTTNAAYHLFSVPANRNYSLSIFPQEAFPVSVRFTDICSTLDLGGSLNQSGVNVTSYWAINGTYLINLSVNSSYTPQWFNGTMNCSGFENIVEMRIVAYTMEDADMVFESWSLPYNFGNMTGMENDTYDLDTNFSMVLPATEATSYIMLRAYARNSGGTYFMGSHVLNSSSSVFEESNHDFTMAQMVSGSNKSISSNNVTDQWNNTKIVNTTSVVFNLINSTGVFLSNDGSSVEIKRELNGSYYSQFVQASNGQFNLSIAQGEEITKLTIFSQQYAPVSTRISANTIAGTDNTTTISCWGGVCNITLRSFGEFDPLNMDQDLEMNIMTYSTDCNVPNPPASCSLCGDGMDEGQFSPFNAILKGSTNMWIASGDISVYYINVDLLASGPPDAAFTDSSTNSSAGLEAAWQFGSQGPDIYDYVLLKIPYDPDMDTRNITVKIPVLYDNDFNEIWNLSAGNTTADINTDPALVEYRDYLGTSYENYFTTTGVFCNASDPTLSSGLSYKDVTNHTLWIKILHFSGLGPTVVYVGGNASYIVEDSEAPTDGLTNVSLTSVPQLYALCRDNDSVDNMNATWMSNSSGSWIAFATNLSIANNTNITQTNGNFSSPSTKYWWSVNLSDGLNWYNETFTFTTNYAPSQTGISPVNNSQISTTTPPLYVICSDNNSDVMTAYWYSNSSGSWVLFGQSNSVITGTNITQTNSNFTSYSTDYYWRLNVTDGRNWTNATYKLAKKAAPGVPTSFDAVTSGTTAIILTWAKGTNADKTYIEWNNTANPWPRGYGTQLYNSTGTTTTHSGLSSGSTFKYQAWSYNSTYNLFSTTNASDSATTSSGGGGNNNGGSGDSGSGSGSGDTTTDDTTTDEETGTTTSDDTLDDVNEEFGLDLTESFYANDTDSDGIVDSFTDPNGALTSVDNLTIGGNNVFLLSTGDDEIPEFFWNTDSDTITVITHALGTINSSVVDTENETATYVIDVNKSDWIYIDIDDPYPNYAVTVKASNGTTIAADKIWRINNKIYVLDDPSAQYDFIYSLAIILPTFTPQAETIFTTVKPNITIVYQEEVQILNAAFGGNDILDQLTTDDNMTFVFTSTIEYSNGQYILYLHAIDNESNPLYTNTTYHVSIPSDDGTVPVEPSGEIPVLWVVLIVILIIVFIIWFLFKSGYLYFEDETKTEKLDQKIRSSKKKK